MDLPPALMPPLTDNAWLVLALAEVTARPLEEVRRILASVQRAPQRVLATELRELGIRPYVYTPELEAYYQQTDTYLFGGVVWNRDRYKVRMRQWIGEYLARGSAGSRRVLTIGDGVGVDSLYLTQCGHRVACFEPSDRCRRFARKLFDHCGQRLQVVGSLQEIAAGSCDVVLCLDVLEHVPDPLGMVADFARCLCDGGLLVVHAPFYFVSPANPTHLDCNRRFSGDMRRLYGSQGFQLRDGRRNWDPLILEKTPPGGVARTPARASRIAELRLMGWLFAVGRYWCAPHNLAASLAVGRGDRKWLQGLDALPDS